jgi:2-iminobutanoate/2-iminopropanoate deaminase
MRSALRHAAFVASIAVVGPATLVAQRQVVTAQGMNATATLSPAIRVGDILFLSGQLPTTRGADADTTIGGQTKSALEKIKTLVEAAGGTMANVAKCTVFLVDVKDFGGMNSAYSSFWPKEPPARSTVVVAALVAPAKLEIECIASLK